jgi:threonine/homoserine/homoserine lactone efflux protein
VISQGELAVYFVLVFGIIVLPGMDMAFVLGNALVGGLRAGLGAVAGIMTAGVFHLTMGTAGVALALRAMPALFTVMLIGGSAYLAWIGWSLLRAGGGAATSSPSRTARGPATPASAFRGAIATSLLNPKAYLFTLAVVPQFVHPERGSIWLQVGALVIVTSATQAAIYGGLALTAARGRGWLAANPGASAWTARVVGVGLMSMAVVAAVEGWRG